MPWDQLASDESLKKTIDSLKSRGIESFVAESGGQAREKFLEIVPEGAEVMNMTSMTLEAAGIANEVNESGKFVSVRKKLESIDKNAQHDEARRLESAPQWAAGSVHAVTEDGMVVIASATGSQVPAYAYGSNVVWVVGTQKIVKDIGAAMERIESYVFPLEDDRARKAYGVGSGINKLLILNREVAPGRIRIIFVKEKLGF